MGRVNLAIVDQDTQYLDLFLNYLRKSEYAGRIAVKAFSRMELFKQSVDQGNMLDIILIDAALYNADPDLFKLGRAVLLSADPLYQCEGIPVIHKYQALHQILAQVMAHYVQDNDAPLKGLGGNRSTRIISIYGGTGGCGKTTLALNLAANLADQGQRVFYLNLESLPACQMGLGEGNGGDFSRVLYYLKGNPAQFIAQFDNLYIQVAIGNFHTFKPAPGLQDILEMSSDETSLLLAEMARLGRYDAIVVDLESSMHERNLAAMKESDMILWLMLDDAQCLQKNRLLLDALPQLPQGEFGQCMPRVRFVLNKRLTQVFNNIQTYGLVISGFLPYVPEWKAITSMDQVLASPFFRQETARFYNSLA